MLLEYVVNFDLFYDGRLNPDDVPLEEAGDCGANTLLLLGLIEFKDAVELSKIQNECWKTKSGKEFTVDYLLNTYLFTDPTKQYEIKECNEEELMIEIKKLTPGYGTFLFMKDPETKLGHFTCIYKNVDTEEIEVVDLQTEEIINDKYEPGRLHDFLSRYELFCIPIMLDTTTPVRRRLITPISEEKPFMYHGSPAKTIPSPARHPYRSPVRGYASEHLSRSPLRGYASEHPYRSPEVTRSPVRGHASEHPESPPRLIRSRRDPLSENINAFEYVQGEAERPVRSPLTPPKKKRGGTRKRKTRRKN